MMMMDLGSFQTCFFKCHFAISFVLLAYWHSPGKTTYETNFACNLKWHGGSNSSYPKDDDFFLCPKLEPKWMFSGRVRRYHPDYDPVTGQILRNLQIALEHQTWRASRANFLPCSPWWEGDDFYWGLDHDPAWMRQEAMRATGKMLAGTCFFFGDRWWVGYDQVLFFRCKRLQHKSWSLLMMWTWKRKVSKQ